MEKYYLVILFFDELLGIALHTLQFGWKVTVLSLCHMKQWKCYLWINGSLLITWRKKKKTGCLQEGLTIPSPEPQLMQIRRKCAREHNGVVSQALSACLIMALLRSTWEPIKDDFRCRQTNGETEEEEHRRESVRGRKEEEPKTKHLRQGMRSGQKQTFHCF